MSLSRISLTHPLATRRKPWFSLLLGCLVACGALAVAPVPAGASRVSSAYCNEFPLSQPFQRWGDANVYELAPGGDFESTLSWTVSGGATKAKGSESYAATGTAGAYSLYLPAGATATSPYTCVNASYPTFRFFARREAVLSTLTVEVLYRNTVAAGGVPSGVLVPASSWAPSPQMQTAAIVGGILSGGQAQMALRFRALGGASRIDDVFIDPRMH